MIYGRDIFSHEGPPAHNNGEHCSEKRRVRATNLRLHRRRCCRRRRQRAFTSHSHILVPNLIVRKHTQTWIQTHTHNICQYNIRHTIDLRRCDHTHRTFQYTFGSIVTIAFHLTLYPYRTLFFDIAGQFSRSPHGKTEKRSFVYSLCTYTIASAPLPWNII